MTEIPLSILLAALIFLIQWIAFIPAYIFQTEKYYDLIGSLTYLTVMAVAVFLSPIVDGRSILLLTLVSIWATRLGSFLFFRIRKEGKDSRFELIKPSFIRFFLVWNMQGAWVLFTLASALAAITVPEKKELGVFTLIGLIIWILGFMTEVLSDWQKNNFKKNPDNQGKFIQNGLWAWSRHPNYLGEIILWVGIAVIAIPVLHGWRWSSLISPIFVFLLITQVSGIPLLEKAADKKWGGQEEYESYKAKTPILFPRLTR